MGKRIWGLSKRLSDAAVCSPPAKPIVLRLFWVVWKEVTASYIYPSSPYLVFSFLSSFPLFHLPQICWNVFFTRVSSYFLLVIMALCLDCVLPILICIFESWKIVMMMLSLLFLGALYSIISFIPLVNNSEMDFITLICRFWSFCNTHLSVQCICGYGTSVMINANSKMVISSSSSLWAYYTTWQK